MLTRLFTPTTVAVACLAATLGSISGAPTLQSPRRGACAAAVGVGRVLIAGGATAYGPVNTAEWFDSQGRTTPAASMIAAHSEAVCAALADGRVLVAGSPTAQAEIYDPVSDRWSAAGSMLLARSGATASLLPDGRILIAGGEASGVPTSTLEIFDPASGAFRQSNALLTSPRKQHAAVALEDGRVLILGGSDGAAPLATVDVYDPVTDTISAGPPMTTARAGLTATRLLTGQVFVAGGNDGSADRASTELFDPAAGHFSPKGNMSTPRSGHLAFLIPGNNSVLLAGGAAADLYIPWLDTFRNAGPMAVSRSGAAGSPLKPGTVIVAGGANVRGAALDTIESYSTATLATDGVTVTGAGWQPGEIVTLVTQRDGATPETLTATADDQGGIVSSGVRIGGRYVVATGGTSGMTAMVMPLTTGTITTTTTVGSSANPSVFGQSVTFTATVTSNGGTPVGSVEFLVDGGNKLLTSTDGTGKATFTTSALTTGTHTITADYLTTGSFKASSGSLQQTVNQADTLTTITNASALAAATVVGQPVTVNWSVTAVSPGAGTPTGTLEANDVTTNSTLCIGPLGNGGCSFTPAAVRSYSLVAVYIHDTNFNNSYSSFVTHTVNKADTQITITNASALATATVVGQLITVTWSFAVVSPGSGTPTGNAQVVKLSDGTVLCSAAVGATQCSFTSTSPETYSLRATYVGDGNFSPGYSQFASHTVNQASTTITITNAVSLAATATVVGQPITVSWSFAVVSPGSGTPTGNAQVQNLNTGAVLCSAAPGAGQCSFTPAAPVVDYLDHLTANYGGDVNFLPSSAQIIPHTVNQASTATTITNAATLANAVVGQPLTVTWSVAPVSPGAGTPTGTVTASLDGSVACAALVGAGQCTLPTAASLGSHMLIASYPGDSNFASSSATVTVTVTQGNTTTTITSPASVVGQTVTVMWSVTPQSPAAGTPTGTVTISGNGSSSCSAVPVANGQCNMTFTAAGTYTLTATYSGDLNFNGSAAAVRHAVTQGNSTTTITALNLGTPTVVGQAYTVQWSVVPTAPAAGTPTGSVTVNVNGSPACTAPVNQGQCNITPTSAGTQTLVASYGGGDANFSGSQSAAATHTVTQGNSTTTITALNLGTPTVVGQAYTVQWSVVPTAPAAGTPTGSVTVNVNGSPGCTAQVASGQCNITPAAIGTFSLVASYAGDSNFNGSQSGPASHTVNQASTTTTITGVNLATPSLVGQAYTVQWSVVPTAPAGGTPTGNVTVSVNGGPGCTAPVAAGQCNITPAAAGTQTLAASYAGDGNFTGSQSASVTHQVNPGNAPISIANAAALASPSVTGQPFEVDWTFASGTPTGNVTVNANGVAGCTAAAAAGKCNVTPTAAGTYSLVASYSGDANNSAGSSGAVSHTVNQGNTTIAIANASALATSTAAGQPYVVTWMVLLVAPAAGTPTGAVTVSVNGVAACTAPVATGQCNITPAASGIVSLTASYAGDANFNGSASAAVSHTVNAQVVSTSTTTTTITNAAALSSTPSATGQSVTVNWSVTPAGTPTGTVTVNGTGSVSCSAPLAAGQCAVTWEAAGPQSLTAVYSGDANFSGSTSASAAHTVTASPAPAPVSVSPAFGSGAGATFTFTFTAPGGFQTLQVVDVIIRGVLDGRSACYIAFQPATAGSGGSVFLVDDFGDAGGPYQGLVLPGSGKVSNGQCTVDGSASSVNGSGNNLAVTLAITFNSSFAGNKVFYLSAQDLSANNSGWQALGTWGVPGLPVNGPSIGGVSPGRSTNATQTYAFTFTDTNGWQDLSIVNILVNSAIDGRHGCYIAFQPSTSSIFLVDDGGDAGGPYAGMALPTSGSVSNSQCTISGAGAMAIGSGNTFTLTLPITFNHSFTGNQVFYLAARSNTQNSDWQPVGTGSVP